MCDQELSFVGRNYSVFVFDEDDLVEDGKIDDTKVK